MIKIQIIDDIRAQIPFEFMMVVGFSLIITISLVTLQTHELNQAMTASRTGDRWFYFGWSCNIPYGHFNNIIWAMLDFLILPVLKF